MFTYLGKFLVLLNAFASVVVIAWASAAYLTRIDPADAVDASGENIVEKVKRLDKRAKEVQAGYDPELDRVADADARLQDLRVKIAARLDQSEKGKFYDIYAVRGGQKDPTNPNAVAKVGNIIWADDPAREIKALDGKPLAGVDDMRANLIREQSASSGHIGNIEGSVKKLTELNADIDVLNARLVWLDERMKRHEQEMPILADLRVNWENRGGSLQRRRTQLLARLDDLKGAKVGGSPASPSAITTNK